MTPRIRPRDFAQMLPRGDYRGGDNLIRGENGRGSGRSIADENAEVEPRALEAAMSGRESEANRDIRCGEVRVHALRALTDSPQALQCGR